MDTEDGERLAEANSVWSLINHKKGVPVRVLPEMVEKIRRERTFADGLCAA